MGEIVSLSSSAPLGGRRLQLPVAGSADRIKDLMNKRTFLKTSVAVAAGGTMPLDEAASAAERDPARAEYFELRTWSLKPEKVGLLNGYLSNALIPAVGRLGGGPVGVFSENGQPGEVLVHTLLVHSSADQCASLPARLADDAAYRKDAQEYLDATAADPVYARIESSLLRGISGMPKLARPDPSQPRLFNLRIYESHNERAAAKKLEMFNTAEMAIFRRVGLTPVFFGEAILGSRLPNLTYMLVFSGEDARKAAWDQFRADPEWVKLKAIPEYADKEIVSKITNKLLTPAAFSQI